jgi:predicted house-cleaning noncanonical NTP pyrophosphatase (MazG superfamily)
MRADGKPRLVKLVRDGVGRFFSPFDNRVDYMPVTEPELAVPALRAKLVEEVIEYVTNPSLEELADVWEVMAALAYHDLGSTMYEVRTEAEAKRVQHGGFGELIGMYITASGGD